MILITILHLTLALKYSSTIICEVSCSRARDFVSFLSCVQNIIQIHVDEISAGQQGLIHDHFSYFVWRGRFLFQIKEFWREFLSFRCNVILEL